MNIEILQKAAEAAATGIAEFRRSRTESQTAPEYPGWRFAQGLTLLYSPQFRCRACGQDARIYINYLVDVPGERIVRAWDSRDGSRVPWGELHPHVDPSGGVCRGVRGIPVIQALTSGISQGPSYYDQGQFARWLDAYTDHENCGLEEEESDDNDCDCDDCRAARGDVDGDDDELDDGDRAYDEARDRVAGL